MVNNTVKIGKAAGIADKPSIKGLQVMQTKRGLDPLAKVSRENNLDEFITIKAYHGGNPTKARKADELTH